MMKHAFSKFDTYTSFGIGLGASTLVRLCSSHVWSGSSTDFNRLIHPWEGACLLEGQVAWAAL